MMQKRNLKYRIYGFEVRCASLISQGLLEGKGKQQILRTLKKELLRFNRAIKLTSRESSQLWIMCLQEYRLVSKEVWGKRKEPEKVYLAIRKTLPLLESVKNKLGNIVETRYKTDYLVDLKSKGIFYLCSYHTGAAQDHKNYQGKMYVSQEWKSRCKDEEERFKVESYIRNHKCLTLEYIVDKPVYMCTRPNCRHYFKEMPIEEVLHSSVRKILNQHGMKQQTVGSYEYWTYRNYYERLKILMSLKEYCDCDTLRKDIKSTRVLIKKWLSLMNR